MASLLSSIGAVDLQALAETVKQKGGSLVQEASALADKLSLDRLQDGDQTVRQPSSSPSEVREAVPLRCRKEHLHGRRSDATGTIVPDPEYVLVG